MTTTKPFSSLTAADLKSQTVIVIPELMAIRDAAMLLFNKHISGAPVVDAKGRCIGAISTTDIAHLAMKHGADVVVAPTLPVTCNYQDKQVGPDGRELVRCTLESGVCPFQATRETPAGEKMTVCSQPHCVCVDWQIVEVEKLPEEHVRAFMSTAPVTATPQTAVKVLAKKMNDAGVHRVFIVDDEQKPIGVVSSTDILAAVAASS